MNVADITSERLREMAEIAKSGNSPQYEAVCRALIAAREYVQRPAVSNDPGYGMLRDAIKHIIGGKP